ncbi:urease accessory protein UreF [Undibacterium sp. LX40W]|uniref:Urease accessory protein UreF n=1 Tax=Undibacterium nitidum TaxID=2762298 RepID=A0A923HPJ8_9BURK|nr:MULTISPECIES: urease accessory protein UreF [Undibacterium]MBC3882208.1 urease accessory protein UreF [Undibacterium nitidum]MBC3892489.1 urease accessory protein UreF [Undibacterium sp. LX40W]
MQTTALLHLLQLASPSLPIGGFSYSQGLETAIERGEVKDAETARVWISSYLNQVVAYFEAPMLWRLMRAFYEQDSDAVRYWSEVFLASRDTAEFRAETVQMGYSLAKLVAELAIADDEAMASLQQLVDIPLPTAMACAAVALQIPAEAVIHASLFTWVENQVLVCVKSVPLGQVAGQRLLLSMRDDIANASNLAMQLEDDALSNWAPGLSLLSMQHEVQYSRLYRS